jgi:ribosome biogenesis protein Tsr3
MMIIILHSHEDRKKCSLSPIRDLPQFTYFPDTKFTLPEKALILHPDGPPLDHNDRDRDLVLIDATWKYHQRIMNREPVLATFEQRSIEGFTTVFPRKDRAGKSHPTNYLASIEVIIATGLILQRSEYTDVIKYYHFGEEFLSVNKIELE